MPEWTHAQKMAIESRNGTVLVSAAAGSGKTAVLVERVIQRLEDKVNPCPADGLLIVTFTKNATAQMKEKIAAALDKRIEENPDDEYLIKQRMLLPFATISTIDGFCGDIVKENFHELGISPDYKIAEEAELRLMRQDAVEAVLENAYKTKNNGFSTLLDSLISADKDDNLASLIISLYNTSRAYAYPDKWLDSLVSDYENAENFKETKWGKYLLSYIKEVCQYHCNKLTSQIKLFNDDMSYKNSAVFNYDISFFEKAIFTIENGTWDELLKVFSEYKPPKNLCNIKTYDGYELAKATRNAAKDAIKKQKEGYLYCTEDEYKEDIAILLPAVKELVRLVKEFSDVYSEIKMNADSAEFSDICAYAIKLLVKDIDEEGNPVKTDLAKSISEKFTEILVDEFQDINEQQNILFKALSKDNGNLFMVGDVKQSIYKFRLAMPQIFINIKKSFPDYDSAKDNYPAKINLDFNFRSRKGVTDFVNFLFNQLMSEDVGEIDYNNDEALKPRATYAESPTPDAEVHILPETGKSAQKYIDEGDYIAQYIENAIKNGLTVKDGDGVRPAEYKDFCILLKAVKGRVEHYVNALKKRGIPCYASNSEGFFEATEIRTVLSIMRVVDNPLQDVPLLSAMISPVFGFTPDELASLRTEKKNVPFWICVKCGAENGKTKCKAFLEEIKRLRSLSVTLGAGEFIREILDSTGYLSTVRAMQNGSQRAANLSLLLEYAEKYESAGHIGLSGFIRFIDRVQKEKSDFEVANEISENANVVRLMTVHKSKGLEFPVCILADCSGKFNDQYAKGAVDFTSENGIGFKRVDGDKRFPTLPYTAVVAAHTRSNRSEELRDLYVALTRAKEKMICILRYTNPEKKIIETMMKLDENKKIAPLNVLNCQSFSDMILLASLKHFDSNAIPAVSANRCVDTLPCESQFVFKLIADYENDDAEIEFVYENKEASDELLNMISERVDYRYPYSNLSTLVAKVSPSQLENAESTTAFFAKAKPKFIQNSESQSASKGTAVHKFMEFYDYSLGDNDVRKQAEIMLSQNKISPAEEKLLEYDKLSAFFTSETAKRISSAEKLEREKKITFSIGADEIYGSEYSHDEKIIVQGYIDCAFIEDGQWVVVDYKTDRVKDVNILKERYRGQLKMYERALAECTGIPVKETVIYSLYKNEIVYLD
ncbi:MAG: helicase-exonuclease AddAB subunit AddA [Clostridia bacterium]|nr:helicase-exonuclease AddAB subunit AddA [Clostridia bacterium]